MRQKKKYVILTFKTTTAAMAMERKCAEGIPGRLIPLPGEISAGCGLSWRILPEEYAEYEQQIQDLNIRFEDKA